MNLSEKLKKCRVQHNMTQLAVANILHVSRKTVSGWENNRSYPDTSLLVKLSDLYHIPLDDLVRDDHLLKYYSEQQKNNDNGRRLMNVSYKSGFLLLLLGYIEFFRPWGVHSLLIPILLVMNSAIFYSHFTNWQRFSSHWYAFLAIIVFLLLILTNIVITVFDQDLLNLISQSSLQYVTALFFGRILLVLLISLNLEMLLIFRPQKQNLLNNRNK